MVTKEYVDSSITGKGNDINKIILIDVLKAILNDELRNKPNVKKCSRCQHCIRINSSYGYCDKHNRVICIKDICIEEL